MTQIPPPQFSPDPQAAGPVPVTPLQYQSPIARMLRALRLSERIIGVITALFYLILGLPLCLPLVMTIAYSRGGPNVYRIAVPAGLAVAGVLCLIRATVLILGAVRGHR